MNETQFGRTRARIEQVTDEFNAAEIRLIVEKEKRDASHNPITKVFHSMRVRRASNKLGRLYAEGESLDELYHYDHRTVG